MKDKKSNYTGEFNEYARPFDRYLDENRFKEIEIKRREKEFMAE